MLAPMTPAEQHAIDQLAKGALRGAPQTAWSFFEAAWPALDRRMATYLRSLRLADEFREDCGQNTFLRVWKAREDYRGGSPDEFFAWLYQITRREAQRLTDKAGRSAIREADANEAVPIEQLDRQGLPDLSASELQAEEEARALEECIEGLDTRSRELVELLYGAAASTERAVASMLQISKSYVNTQRHQALDALARCLKGKGVEK
jgi:RNA polymerase sigma factor (sigma-70 family)